jgi:ketosteroid isomerase-like protein
MNLRSTFLLSALLAVAAVPHNVHADTGTNRSLPANLRGAEEALNSFHQALRAGDRKAALALLAQDALIYESGHAEGKTEYAAHHLDADIAFAKEVPGTTVKRTGGLAGPVAWLTTEGRTTGNYKGKALDRRTVETVLMRRKQGKWVIVHLHWSSAASK